MAKSQRPVKVNGQRWCQQVRGGWRQQTTWWMTSADDVAMTWQMTSPRADVSRGTLARGGSWRRVTLTPKLLVARRDAWEVRWRLNFTEREIGEISFRWCNLWFDRRSGSGGGDKAVVFDVLKSRWRQWCCSQQRLQMAPKKTRLLKSGTPKD